MLESRPWLYGFAAWLLLFILAGRQQVQGESGAADKSRSAEPRTANAPDLVPHLQLWLRADALGHPDGSPVPVWPDQSGHGRDLSATKGIRHDGAGSPATLVRESRLHRRPALRFDPATGLAASPGNPPQIRGDAALSILLVMYLEPHAVGSPYDGVIGIGNPAHAGDPGRPLAALVQINRGEDHALHFAGGWNHDATLGPGTFKPFYGRAVLLTVTKRPGPMRSTTRVFVNGEPLFANGQPVDATKTSGADGDAATALLGSDAIPDIQHRPDIGIYMGHAQSWSGSIQGDVGEVIVYDKALTDEERRGLEVHLAEKFAITLRSDVEATRAEFTADEKSHWAFQPVADSPPPSVRDEAWIASPIDRFILAGLEKQSLSPAPAADKRTLLRRVTFDLTGLPPTPEEMDAFLADTSSDAFRTVVNRLLDSPHYGERWGRHWLDAVRYAETTANDANAVMRFAWRYRDYVVDAFNRDLPYDRFLVEQLAGDLLPPTTDLSEAVRRVIATGFLMVGPKALAETDKEQSRMDIVDDQIDVTSRAMLGLTVACARCHDHKFDPIPTVDYYALAGIFRSTEPFQDEVRNASMWWEFPLLQVPGEKPLIVMAPREGQPRNLRIHQRGNRFSLGAIAPRGFLQVLDAHPFPPASAATAAVGAGGAARVPTSARDSKPAGLIPTTGDSGRLELAQWIASCQNPLTARVMVNRLWQHHFGRGLVTTGDNFGRRGERPTHPELLDYLAARFMEAGWSVKAMHRWLLLSSTYRQSSDNPAAVQSDPENRWLSRMPWRRLEAEAIRDSILAVSGRLDRTIGGGEASDVLVKEADVLDAKRGFFTSHMQPGDPYYSTSLRRSIYLPVVRNGLPDVLALFDAADPNGVTSERNDTTVSSQSLFLMNNSFVREQALALAQRLLDDQKMTDDERVKQLHLLTLGRSPSPDEIAESLEYVARYSAAPATRTRPEHEWRLTAWQSLCQSLLCSNEFLYVD
ncbi:MAG: DUF1549 and DUF1553 domain-containing protein [Planctomycetales bacterium]